MTETKNAIQNKLEWTEQEKKKFNEKNNAPFGEAFASGNENMILSKNIFLSMDAKKTHKNANALVIGNADSGKTYNIIRPNLMRAFGSYIVADPDGSLLEASRKKLIQAGYEIKVIDFENPENSDHYNPFKYMHSKDDVIGIVDCILDNKDESAARVKDPFFNKTEASVLTAIIMYVANFNHESERTMAHVLELVTRAKDEPKEFDTMFAHAKKIRADDPSIPYYESAKLASAKTLRAAFVNVSIYLSAFVNKDKDLSDTDTVNLDTVCDANTAIFVTGFNVARQQAILVPMLFMQAFTETMHRNASADEENRSKNFLTILMDDFYNLGHIPEIDRLLSAAKKYRIGVMLTVQSVGQLRFLYEATTNAIINACSVIIYAPGRPRLDIESFETVSAGSTTIKSEIPIKEKTEVQDSLFTHGWKPRQLPYNSCVVCVSGMPACVDEKYTDVEEE